MRCIIASQLLSNQLWGFPFLIFQKLTKESLGCTLLATGLDGNINHFTVLVDSPPQKASLAKGDRKRAALQSLPVDIAE